MPKRQPPPGCEPGEVRVARGSIYGTRDAGRSWYHQHFRDRLANKFRVHESALEKGLCLYEFNGRLTFVTVTHVDDLFYAYDTRCKTTKSLLDAIVKEFNMSRKQDDFVFCGRRVRVTSEALIVSQELAASSLAPMELCGTQRSPETMLTYSEHREYRSLLGKLQWLQLQSRPDLSYEVNRAAQRSSAPTVADARALNAISLKAQRSSETTLRYPRGVINVSSAQLVTYWRRLLRQHGRFEKSVPSSCFWRMSPGVSGMVNFSSDIWFTGRAAQSNVWFGVLSQLRHTQYQKLLKKHSGFDLSWQRCGLLFRALSHDP